MDMPPNPVPTEEQVIEQKLIDCGLERGGFSVAYQDELQSIEIVISGKASVRDDQFQCVNDATWPEFVTFEDPALDRSYSAFTTELMKPQLVAMARAEVERLGILEGFPARANFASGQLFAEALEAHCGMAEGSAIQPLDETGC